MLEGKGRFLWRAFLILTLQQWFWPPGPREDLGQGYKPLPPPTLLYTSTYL